MSTLSNIAALVSVAALGLAGAGAAQAASETGAPSIHVSLADLNLGTQSGAKVALERIHDAARDVCGPAADIRDPAATGRFSACYHDAVNQSVAALGNVTVTAMNGGQSVTTLASR